MLFTISPYKIKHRIHTLGGYLRLLPSIPPFLSCDTDTLLRRALAALAASSRRRTLRNLILAVLARRQLRFFIGLHPSDHEDLLSTDAFWLRQTFDNLEGFLAGIADYLDPVKAEAIGHQLEKLMLPGAQT